MIQTSGVCVRVCVCTSQGRVDRSGCASARFDSLESSRLYTCAPGSPHPNTVLQDHPTLTLCSKITPSLLKGPPPPLLRERSTLGGACLLDIGGTRSPCPHPLTPARTPALPPLPLAHHSVPPPWRHVTRRSRARGSLCSRGRTADQRRSRHPARSPVARRWHAYTAVPEHLARPRGNRLRSPPVVRSPSPRSPHTL